MHNDLIYGRNKVTRIVSIEDREDGTAEIFREHSDGRIESYIVNNKYYILFAEKHNHKFQRLDGNQTYCWLWETDSREKYKDVLSNSYKNRYDMHVVRDPKEAIMLREGYTYFKDMKVNDVSVLSFDIETNGLEHNSDSKVFLISNTLRKNGKYLRKLFSLDEFESQDSMLRAWCSWVQKVDPSILVGHNIYGFDLPYLSHVAGKNVDLLLGRDSSEIRFADRVSQFRKDGSQTYDYTNAWIYGREIVDTYFLSIKYDIARNYESYGLKTIIEHEGLQRKDRQFYDAAQIAKDWGDPEKRKLIKKYAEHDADDALALYDLMIPALFYYAQSIPRSFQQIINSATGSQINSLIVRGYLQRGYSIAKGSDKKEFKGAISFSFPGVYSNVLRVDASSLYPSIMRQFRIYNKNKDPEGLFLKVVDYFTLERLKNKQLAKQSSDRYYKDLSESQKIAINSMYGFLGAPRLNYNYMDGAEEVTRRGREILKNTIKHLTGKELEFEQLETDIG